MKELIIDDNVVLIDDEDYDYLTLCYDLSITKDGYAHCRPKKKFKRKKMGLFSMTLHKMLINPEKKGRNVVVDHKDGNKLNNQKSNLRICTHQENMRNRKIAKNKTTNYKGVYKNKDKWDARIQVGEHFLYLGIFTNEVAAANCYNHYAEIYYGEFASPNGCPYMSEEEWKSYKLGENKTSKYRGVSLNNGKWKAQIWDGKIKKNIQLGDFDNEIDAAKAYNKKSIELNGEKARLNKI